MPEENLPEEEVTTEEIETEVPAEGVPEDGGEEMPTPDEMDDQDETTIDNILDAIYELPIDIQSEIYMKLGENLDSVSGPDFEDEAVVAEKQEAMSNMFL